MPKLTALLLFVGSLALLVPCGLRLRASEVRAHAQDAPQQVPLIFHVAELDGKPVAEADFLRSQLEHANTIYRSLGLELVQVGQRKLGATHARLVTRGERDALGASIVRAAINCFIVAQLMDVDEPGRERRGVHWHVRGSNKHLVIVSAISGPYVLAHELGHFLGNPEHSDVAGNLMSYQHTEQIPVLDPVQVGRVKRTIEALFRSRELQNKPRVSR